MRRPTPRWHTVMTRSTDSLVRFGAIFGATLLFGLPAAAQSRRCGAGQELDGVGVCVPKDRDGDGIANAVDACPGEAEDRNGFQDDDGCPDEPLRLRHEAERAAETTREADAESRRIDACFDSADQRSKSAREGFTSVDSALEAQRACIQRDPRSARALAARPVLAELEATRVRQAEKRAHDERARRLALSEDYRSKASLQYALGTSFAIIAGGATAGGLGFLLGQPFGKDDVKNTVGASICLGFVIMFGVETYLRFDQGLTHSHSARTIRPVALTADGFALSF